MNIEILAIVKSLISILRKIMRLLTTRQSLNTRT